MRVRAAALVLCCGALIAGCSSEQEPRSLPPAPSASPSTAALPLPPEAAAETPVGATAFVRYYLEVVNAAFASGDASQVRSLSDPGCDACNNLITAVEKKPDPQERVEGGDYRVVFAESPPVDGGDVVVDLRYGLTAVRVLDPSGGVVRTKPAVAAIDAQMRLVRRGSSWSVRGFRNMDS